LGGRYKVAAEEDTVSGSPVVLEREDDVSIKSWWRDWLESIAEDKGIERAVQYETSFESVAAS